MAKASLKLARGTMVQIEGSAEEVKELLQFYANEQQPLAGRLQAKKTARPDKEMASSEVERNAADLTGVVNLVKTCDEVEAISKEILDRTSQVDRTLLPLYVIHEYRGNVHGLSSGEIAKITRDLGVPVSQPNASRTLSGTAVKYVIGDRVRKKGQPVR